MRNEVDHIDPQWKEGRNYQTVCGFDVALNYREVYQPENTRKSNRFLPWRQAIDEIGGVPTSPGDLCQFLDPDTNDWVLAEFLGQWWMEKSVKTAGYSQPYGPNYKGNGREGCKHSPETKQLMRQSALSRPPTTEIAKQNMRGKRGPNKGASETYSQANYNRPEVECSHCGQKLKECYLPRHMRTKHGT